MVKYISKTTVDVPAGTTATVSFPAASANELLLVLVSSNTTLSTPSGWSAESAVSSTGTYAFSKLASAGEASVVLTRAISAPMIVTVLRFPAGSSVLARVAQADVPRSGVAVSPGLTGLTSTPKFLLHLGSWEGASAATLVWADATVTEHWRGYTNGGFSISQVLGSLEDSTLTTYAPTVNLSDTSGYVGNTERITIAVSVAAAAPATPLATPVLTLVSEVNPTAAGGTNGSATVSWPAVPNAHHYEAGIASGAGQTSGFTTVSANAVSPFTFSNLGAGARTLAIRAMPTA